MGGNNRLLQISVHNTLVNNAPRNWCVIYCSSARSFRYIRRRTGLNSIRFLQFIHFLPLHEIFRHISFVSIVIWRETYKHPDDRFLISNVGKIWKRKNEGRFMALDTLINLAAAEKKEVGCWKFFSEISISWVTHIVEESHLESCARHIMRDVIRRLRYSCSVKGAWSSGGTPSVARLSFFVSSLTP